MQSKCFNLFDIIHCNNLYKYALNPRIKSVTLHISKTNFAEKMNCNKAFISLLILFPVPCLFHSIQFKIKFVNDLLKNENISSVLSVRACWSNYDSVKFSKQVNVRVQYPPEHIENIDQSLDSNKIWIFVDMNCSDSFHFVNNVFSFLNIVFFLNNL